MESNVYPFDCRTYIGFDVRELIWSQTEWMTIEEFFIRVPDEASCIQHKRAFEKQMARLAGRVTRSA